MLSVRTIIRIFIWLLVAICIVISSFLFFFGDINRLKSAVEKNLKEQLNCTVVLGDLEWDWYGFKLGVTTSNISLYDAENNLVLQGGPTRFSWHVKNLISGVYSHFYSIDSTNLYANVIRNKKGGWNLIEIFPPGPPPKVDNLRLNNSIVYLVDELNPTVRTTLYKDFNLTFEKNMFSRIRRINLVTRVGSQKSTSSLKVKGLYTEGKKFNWSKSVFDLFILAKDINLANWQPYITSFIKEPEIKKISGQFSGITRLKKNKYERFLKLMSRTKTNDFIVEFQNKDASQKIEIPKTDFVLRALVDENKIKIHNFKSNIDELSYKLNGYIFNWSKPLPEGDLVLKTNKFNFKTVKPYLPLSLLPPDTRTRIEPINDDGYLEIDVKLKGPLIAPKYYGTILLSDFNLTAESGFLDVIKGLEGKLILNNEVLTIDHLNIPIEGSPLTLKGEIDSKNIKTSFNINGKKINISILQDLLLQSGLQSSFLNQLHSKGALDLNLDVLAIKNEPPEIKGKLSFHDTELSLFEDEPLEANNVTGDLYLDGMKVTFNNLNGLINNEPFSINGSFSLKEDEKINLALSANHLKIIPYVISFITAKTPIQPLIETITGDVSNLNLNIQGIFSKPDLRGKLSINNVSFQIPKLESQITNVAGGLRFEGDELVIEDLGGKIQDSNFAIAGYIDDLFSSPKPRLRLVAGDLDLKNLWGYIKDQLKTTTLNVQANALQQLEGFASLDIFFQGDLVLGNIYFQNTKIKHNLLPFDLQNLSGRLVIGETKLGVFNLMGLINDSNNFTSNLTIDNYLNPNFTVQGQLYVDLDLPHALKAINAPDLNIIKTDGLIPTTVNFGFTPPVVNLSFYSTLPEMLLFILPPYITKPTNKDYTLSGNIDFDTNKQNAYINQLNIKANKLSLTTNGTIKNISSKNPELMIYFSSDEPCGLFMLTEPITPIMDYMIWGMIDLQGEISGTPSMFTTKANAKIANIEIPELFGKKLTASEGKFHIQLNNENGIVSSQISDVNYVSLAAKLISLSAKYANPVIYLNNLSLEGEQVGNISANGSYDPVNSAVSFNAKGSGLELSSLGSFIFLDPSKISGKTDFSLMIEGRGKTKEEITSNTNGKLSFSVTDGRLGQVAFLQKGLQFANLIGQGLFGLNARNVLALFFKYQDGSFNLIHGDLDLTKGIVKAKEFIYRAKDLFLNAFGFVDLNNSFVGLSIYGYLPEPKEQADVAAYLQKSKKKTETPTTPKQSTGAITIIPDAIGKKRFFIPLISSTPPQYFKLEVKGDLKKPKKITSHARHSFKWLRGNRLKKEMRFVPKVEKE